MTKNLDPSFLTLQNPANIYLFKFNNRKTRKRSEICSKLTIKTLTSFWCFYCLLWIYFIPFSTVSIVDFKQVNAGWVVAFSINNDFSLKMIHQDSFVKVLYVPFPDKFCSVRCLLHLLLLTHFMPPEFF